MSLLLAAEATAPADILPPSWIILIVAGAVLLMLFFAFVIWLTMRQSAKNRGLEHLERMKAIELGQTPGPSAASETSEAKQLHNTFWIAFWIGAGVPIAASSAASSSMISANVREFSVVLAIWICVAIISVASVICATILMVGNRCRSKNSQKLQQTVPASIEA